MEKNQVQLLADLEKLVEENQFVAHANSILETEEITDKVGIKNYPSGFYNSRLLRRFASRHILFQLLTEALSVSIFSLYNLKTIT